jgi:sialate O-acetylesterase
MIQLAKIFQDKMTLQRNKPVKIWGTTDRRQKVTVKIDEIPVLSDAEISGEFVLHLPAMDTGADCNLSIEGPEDRIVLQQVDIGEVWLAGGQSNMQFHLRFDAEADAQIAAADDPHLRFYDVAEYAFTGEADDGFKDDSGWDRWMSFNPENAVYFSAAGYYFARMLRENLNVPVAVVGCNWGGTSASSWLDRKWLAEDPELSVYLTEYETGLQKINMETYAQDNRQIRQKLASPAFIKISDQLLYGNPDQKTLDELAEFAPMFMNISLGPHDANRPGGLYENMLSQIRGLSCAGVIWYQGESDSRHASLYGRLFSQMIRCWRHDWQEELPFLFVQLAPFGSWLGSSGEMFPEVRRQQEWVSKNIDRTYMACIMDSGMEHDIHPKQKRPVGERLALLAIGKVYGQAILCEAPELEQAVHQQSQVILTFAHTGNGLYLRGNQLHAIQILAGDQPVFDYSAAVSGSRLILEADAFTGSRLTLEFAQTPYCEVNLYNSADIPAKPFAWKEA